MINAITRRKRPSRSAYGMDKELEIFRHRITYCPGCHRRIQVGDSGILVRIARYGHPYKRMAHDEECIALARLTCSVAELLGKWHLSQAGLELIEPPNTERKCKVL